MFSFWCVWYSLLVNLKKDFVFYNWENLGQNWSFHILKGENLILTVRSNHSMIVGRGESQSERVTTSQ